MIEYEWVTINQVKPGDTVKLDSDGDPILITEGRINANGIVSLYRAPTDEDYDNHFALKGTDLRAVWVVTSVPTQYVLRTCVPQRGNLVY